MDLEDYQKPIPSDGFEDGGEEYEEDTIDEIILQEVCAEFNINPQGYHKGPGREYAYRPVMIFNSENIVIVTQEAGLDV